jgi:predicted DNA-binding protein
MARKKISTTIYITPEQNELLKVLNQKTRVPVAEYVRPGIESPSGQVQVAASWSANLR